MVPPLMEVGFRRHACDPTRQGVPHGLPLRLPWLGIHLVKDDWKDVLESRLHALNEVPIPSHREPPPHLVWDHVLDVLGKLIMPCSIKPHSQVVVKDTLHCARKVSVLLIPLECLPRHLEVVRVPTEALLEVKREVAELTVRCDDLSPPTIHTLVIDDPRQVSVPRGSHAKPLGDVICEVLESLETLLSGGSELLALTTTG